MKIVLIALIGALAAILANGGIAVFNDGLRPIMPEYLEGRMKKDIKTILYRNPLDLIGG
jgi:hypothetical protein